MKMKSPATLFFVVVLAVTGPLHVNSFSYYQYKTLLSLSHSIFTRVSNLRAARGDVSGAARAKLVAEKIERGLSLGSWGLAWSLGWDYVRNYAWRDFDYIEMYGAVSDVNQIMSYLGELSRAGSEGEKAAWVARNYGNVLGISKRMMSRFLRVFYKSGALRDVMETVQKEVVEGGLLRDCLDLGGNDMKGMLQIVKDLAVQYYSMNEDYKEL